MKTKCDCINLIGQINNLKKEIEDLKDLLQHERKCLDDSRNNVYLLTSENERLKNKHLYFRV